jgi:DNA-binding response OmpR family regulator
MPLILVLSVGLDSSLLEARNKILRSAGFIVESALSVKEAFARFLAGDFDLVTLCHSIPKKESDRLICLIRASGSRAPIVSISGNPSQLDAFANATLEADPDKLLIDIKEVLEKAARAWIPSSRNQHIVVSTSHARSQVGPNLRASRKVLLPG